MAWHTFYTRVLACVVLAASLPVVASDYAVPFGAIADPTDVEWTNDFAAAGPLLDLASAPTDVATSSARQLAELPSVTDAQAEAIAALPASSRADVDALVAAGEISATQARALKPYTYTASGRAVSGEVRMRARYTVSDEVIPPWLVEADVALPYGFAVGVTVDATRFRPSGVHWDATRRALDSDGLTYQARVPRVFAHWQHNHWQVWLGTFEIGFAERLTLDTTRHTHPDGLTFGASAHTSFDLAGACKLRPTSATCSVHPGYRATPDFQVREPFRGIAAHVRALPVGNAVAVSALAFASFQSRSVYQYDLADARLCAIACPAIPLYAGAKRLSYSTIPSLFEELAFGGHVEVSAPWRIGLTGYFATPYFLRIPRDALVFRPSSKWPKRGGFGAIGIDGAVQFDRLHIAAEVARTMDEHGSGDFGAVMRATYALPRHQFEAGVRYFGAAFDNPHARPYASADEFEGQRARNEVGVRAEYFGRVGARWDFRASAQAWANPWALTAGTAPWKLGIDGRLGALFAARPWLSFSGWAAVRATQSPTACEGEDDTVEEVATCTGVSSRIVIRADVHTQRLQAGAQAAMRTRAHPSSIEGSTFAEVSAQLWSWLWATLKARYDTALLRIAAEARAAAQVSARVRITTAYRAVVWLSNAARWPNPEHRLSLEVAVAF